MRRRIVFTWTLALPVLLLALGCGARPVPTRGVLTVGGKPVANVNVMFIPEESDGKPATGVTDSGGAFQLTTFKRNDGALRGSYKVTVTHSQTVEIPANITDPDEQKAFIASQPAKASIIPEKFSSPDQTPLKHRVPEDGNAKFDVPQAK